MPGQRGGIRKDDLVTNTTVMSNVHSCHQKVTAANPRDAPSTGGSTIQSDKLSDPIVISKRQPGGGSVILEILRIGPDGRMPVEPVIAAYDGRALDLRTRSN
jgi:hypothetical protein